MFSYRDFNSCIQPNGPNGFHFLCKILLPSKFIDKSISLPLKRPQKDKFVSVGFGCPVQSVTLSSKWLGTSRHSILATSSLKGGSSHKNAKNRKTARISASEIEAGRPPYFRSLFSTSFPYTSRLSPQYI